MNKNIKSLFLSIGILTLVSSCITKTATPQSVGLSIDSLELATERLHKHVDEGKLPGTFVRIIKDGKVVYDDKYGLIDIVKNKPIKENSLYRIFSMTKPVTAVAIMTLYDQGKLNLDDKVSKYVLARPWGDVGAQKGPTWRFRGASRGPSEHPEILGGRALQDTFERNLRAR